MEKEEILPILDKDIEKEKLDELLQKIFDEYYRNGRNGEGIALVLTKEEYARIDKIIRKEFSKYLNLHAVMDRFEGEEQIRRMRSLYLNPIVSYTPKTFREECAKYGENEYVLAAIALNEISDMALDANYSREAFKECLMSEYDVKEGVAEALSEVYGENRTHLLLFRVLSFLNDPKDGK